MLNSSIWSIDRTLSSGTKPGQSELGGDSYEGVFCISQSPSITGASPSDFFRDISRTLVGGVLSYLPTPPLGQDMTQGQFFKRGLTGFNSEFSFSLTSCLTKAEEPSLSYYLPIAGRRIIGFIPFPRVLGLCEMQSVQDFNSCRRVHFLRR